MSTQAEKSRTTQSRWEAIPNVKLGAIPEDTPVDLLRSMLAKQALLAGYEDARDYESVHLAIVDLLGGLRHLCDRLELDFAELDRRGRKRYLSELYEGDPH